MACRRGCCDTDQEHWRSVSAIPRPSAVTLTERRWDTDMDAYKRLRNDGLQPHQIDGSGDIERKAKTSFEVESGRLIADKAERTQTEALYTEGKKQ